MNIKASFRNRITKDFHRVMYFLAREKYILFIFFFNNIN
jgi:hypothetical protein